jgi:competence protein ComGC
MDNEAKRKEAEERLNLDRMKAMMNQQIQEDKLDQNEDLAELRADTSIEKQEMANESREKLAGMKTKTNGRSN